MPYKETEIDSIRGRAKVFHIFDESNGLSPELPYAPVPVSEYIFLLPSYAFFSTFAVAFRFLSIPR